jgi:adenosylhomocysteine nucleosidase
MLSIKNPILLLVALKNELEAITIPNSIPVVYTGIGKINAATVCQSAILQYQPALIINFGTAGKINPELQELVSIKRVIQRDMNAQPLAARGVTPFCPKPSEYLSETGQYSCGTGDSFVTQIDPWLVSQAVDVVDMELFAIAAVAHQHQIPWRSYKFISDGADDKAGEQWHQRINHGEELFLEELKQLLS